MKRIDRTNCARGGGPTTTMMIVAWWSTMTDTHPSRAGNALSVEHHHHHQTMVSPIHPLITRQQAGMQARRPPLRIQPISRQNARSRQTQWLHTRGCSPESSFLQSPRIVAVSIRRARRRHDSLKCFVFIHNYDGHC